GLIMLIEIKNLKKLFGKTTVLKDISMTINEGEVVSIIGSSGSGKSTLLRCINLLEHYQAGDILFEDHNILKYPGGLNAYRTHVGMIFQSFNLFNNLSVLDNCVIGQVKVLKKSKAEAIETSSMPRYQPFPVVRNNVSRSQEPYVWNLK
ncbi:MAG: amino acid ABC transporter ATP-binding, partial [Erysipelotrichaceae bacterium]